MYPKLFILLVVLLVISSSGCIGSSLNANISPVELKVTEGRVYSFDLVNVRGLGGTEFLDIHVELVDNSGIVELDESSKDVKIQKLSPGESSRLDIYLIAKKPGKTNARLRVFHSGGYKDFILPVTVRGPTLSFSLDNYHDDGEYKIEKEKYNTLTVTVKNDDEKEWDNMRLYVVEKPSDVQIKYLLGSFSVRPEGRITEFQIYAPTEDESRGFAIKIHLLWDYEGGVYLLDEKIVPIRAS